MQPIRENRLWLADKFTVNIQKMCMMTICLNIYFLKRDLFHHVRCSRMPICDWLGRRIHIWCSYNLGMRIGNPGKSHPSNHTHRLHWIGIVLFHQTLKMVHAAVDDFLHNSFVLICASLALISLDRNRIVLNQQPVDEFVAFCLLMPCSFYCFRLNRLKMFTQNHNNSETMPQQFGMFVWCRWWYE